MPGKPFTESEKRKFERIKKMVLDLIKTLDNEKMLNYKRYEDLFQVFEKDPDAFRNWDILNDDSLDSAPYILQLPFEEVTMPQIQKAADQLGIELEDYIYYRQNDPRGERSKTKVPVGYVNLKRVQQILSVKNHYTLDIDERTLKTGDVKGESKNGALSDNETLSMLTLGADRALEEFLGPRADNVEKKRQMYKKIQRDGFVSLDELESSKFSNTTVNTLNTYLLASGIRSDLINNSLETEYTIEENLKKR